MNLYVLPFYLVPSKMDYRNHDDEYIQERVILFTNTKLELSHILMKDVLAFRPGYIPWTRWSDNMTAVFTDTGDVVAIDSIANYYEIVVPTDVFLTNSKLQAILDHLIASIRWKCGNDLEVANFVVKHKICIYTHVDHPPYFIKKNPHVFFKTDLGRELPWPAWKYTIDIHFDGNWNLL